MSVVALSCCVITLHLTKLNSYLLTYLLTVFGKNWPKSIHLSNCTILLMTRVEEIYFLDPCQQWTIKKCSERHKPARWHFTTWSYILVLPPSDSTRCRKTPYPASLTESEKWSWIRIRNPISTKIKLLLEVHPCSHPPNLVVIHEPVLEISCGCAQTHTQTHTQTDTRRWPQDLTAYGAQVITVLVKTLSYIKKTTFMGLRSS